MNGVQLRNSDIVIHIMKTKTITTDKPFPVFSSEADRDYILARLINFSGYGFAVRAGYFGQQAIEKYFKALMVQEEKVYLKTHDLIELSKHCFKFDYVFSSHEFLSKVKIFDDFREVGRYGGESMYDPHSKQERSFITAGVYVWQVDYIKILDEIVNLVRKKLDFKRINYSDSLNAIAKGDKKDLLAGNWNLPVSLQDILRLNNDYYKL